MKGKSKSHAGAVSCYAESKRYNIMQETAVPVERDKCSREA